MQVLADLVNITNIVLDLTHTPEELSEIKGYPIV